jgi:hypothetical protein
MICPYCQHELSVVTMSCPRCGAEYPRSGMPFGMGLRVAAAAGAMMFVSSLILVDCVMNYLPGGSDSSMPAMAEQQSIRPPPDMKSPAVSAMLARWAAQQQNADQPLPQFIGRR